MFDLSSSSSYQTAPLLNSDTAEANCTDFPSSSSARAVVTINQCLSGPQGLSHNDNARKLSSARNPKKRSRASRRVLTTDTTNFRSMVQEFTGIPTSSSHLDTTSKKEIHPINPLLLLSSSHSPSRLLHNNNINYQLPPAYQQNRPIDLSFHPSLPVGFGAKSLSQAMPASLEDLGMNHGHQVNVHMVVTEKVEELGRR